MPPPLAPAPTAAAHVQTPAPKRPAQNPAGRTWRTCRSKERRGSYADPKTSAWAPGQLVGAEAGGGAGELTGCGGHVLVAAAGQRHRAVSLGGAGAAALATMDRLQLWRAQGPSVASDAHRFSRVGHTAIAILTVRWSNKGYEAGTSRRGTLPRAVAVAHGSTPRARRSARLDRNAMNRAPTAAR